MSDFDRRSVLKVGLGGAALLAGPGIVPVRAAEWTNTPEANASIRVLRWKQFIQAEFDKFAEQTKAFSEKTGVKVKLEAESWEDIRPKAAVAANVGAGPDLIIGTLDDPHKFPEKLIDMTDVADKYVSLVALDEIPKGMLDQRPFRRPDFADEWRLLRKAWSLHRR